MLSKLSGVSSTTLEAVTIAVKNDETTTKESFIGSWQWNCFSIVSYTKVWRGDWLVMLGHPSPLCHLIYDAFWYWNLPSYFLPDKPTSFLSGQHAETTSVRKTWPRGRTLPCPIWKHLYELLSKHKLIARRSPDRIYPPHSWLRTTKTKTSKFTSIFKKKERQSSSPKTMFLRNTAWKDTMATNRWMKMMK